MPITVRTSAKQAAIKKSHTSRKRRENQNVEINELASLVPLSTPLVSCGSSSGSLVASGGNKPPAISVLRLTTSYLKLQDFLNTSPNGNGRDEHVSSDGLQIVGRMEEAIDGFLIILDKDANILYVSETITGHVGLFQRDVIGQNLVDITHPEFASEITDSLKPALILPSAVDEHCVISQYRQFCVRFIPSISYSTSPLHSIVQVCGNLKVKLSPLKNCENDVMEFVEPTAIGFVGECRVVETVPSILEISVPCSSFIITRSLDMKKVISIEASVRDVIGYDPKLLLNEQFNPELFLHPADVSVMGSIRGCLIKTGHAVSPRFRFLTASGDWVWMQLEGTLRYKNKTTPQYWEVKIRALSQWKGILKYIEQNEVYSTESDEGSPPAADKKSELIQRPPNQTGHSRVNDAKRMVNSLKSTRLPDTVLEPVLHGRSLAMSDLSDAVKQYLSEKPTKKGAVKYDNEPVSENNDNAAFVAESPSVSLNSSSLTPQSSSLTESVACQTGCMPSSPDSHSTHHSPLSVQASASNVDNEIASEISCMPSLPNNFQEGSFLSAPTSQILSTDTDFTCFTHATSSLGSPFNTSPINSTDFCQPCNLSPSIQLSLHSLMSTESTPLTGAINSQSVNLTQNTIFTQQLPTDFNFSSNSVSSFYASDPMQTAQFYPMQAYDQHMPQTQMFCNSSNLAPNNNLVNPIVQQRSPEMMEQSDLDSVFSVTDPTPRSAFESNFSLQTDNVQYPVYHDPAQNCMSYAQAQVNFCDDMSSLLESDSLTNVHSDTNHEVQDILQQFM